MRAKSVLLVLAVVGAAYGIVHKSMAPQKAVDASATAQPPIPEGAPTYGVMGKSGPEFHVTAETRAQIDKWSTEKVVLFGASWCTYCAAERKAFHERGVRYFEVDVDRDPDAMKFMTTVLGVPAVPATVFGTRFMPGYNAEEFGEILATL
jgi:glutaredoxin